MRNEQNEGTDGNEDDYFSNNESDTHSNRSHTLFDHIRYILEDYAELRKAVKENNINKLTAILDAAVKLEEVIALLDDANVAHELTVPYKDIYGCTAPFKEKGENNPLYTAAENGHEECLRLLIAACKTHNIEFYGNSALAIAVKNGKTTCVKMLFDAGVSPNTNCRIYPWTHEHTPFEIALRFHQNDCLDLIVQTNNFARPDSDKYLTAEDLEGDITEYQFKWYMKVLTTKNIHGLKVLLNLYPEDISKVAREKDLFFNLLSLTCACGFYEAVELLLERGADPTFASQTEKGVFKTPKEIAAENGHLKVVNLLNTYKAPNDRNTTLSTIATSIWHTVRPNQETVSTIADVAVISAVSYYLGQ